MAASSSMHSPVPSSYSEKWAQQFATGFLGYGYDPHKPNPADRISSQGGISLQSHPLDDFIRLITLPVFEVFAFGTTKAKAMKRLAERIYEFFPGAIQNGINPFEEKDSEITDACLFPFKTPSENNTSCKFYIATAMIKALRCELNSLSCLTPTTGGSIITAGWVYTGYQILFEIHIPLFSLKEDLSPFRNYSERWHQSFSWHKVEKLFTQYPISSLRFSAKCYGNLPVRPEAELEHPSQLLSRLNDLRCEYIPYLDQMVFRNYFVDGASTVSNTNPIIQESKLPEPIYSKIDIPRFANLIKNIPTYDIQLTLTILNNNKRLSKETYPLTVLIENMIQVFHKTLHSPYDIDTPSSGYSLFLGNSKTGISTFIARLLGARLKPIKKIYHMERDLVIRDFTLERKHQGIPEAGSPSPKTLGYDIFQRYIDTAGLSSSSTVERNIWNLAAISTVIKTQPIKNITVSLKEDEFLSRKFVEVLLKLLSAFPDLDEPTQLASLLFLVHSHWSVPSNLDNILLHIRHHQMYLCKGIFNTIHSRMLTASSSDMHLTNTIVKWVIDEPCVETVQFQQNFNSLSTQDKRLIMYEKSFNKSILKILYNLKPENFMIINPSSTTSIKQFDHWEANHRTFSSENFNYLKFCDDFGGDSQTLMEIIKAIALYFDYIDKIRKKEHLSLLQSILNIWEYQDIFRIAARVIRRLNLLSHYGCYQNLCDHFPESNSP